MRVVIYRDRGRRARIVCDALAAGLRRLGVRMVERAAHAFAGAPEGEIAAFYGLKGRLREVYTAYRAANHTTVLVDLGYWGRSAGGRLAGYHKISVDGLHPSRYFQRRRHPPDRFARLGIEPRPFLARAQGYVLLAGMSAKAAWVYGLAPEAWEREAAAGLRRATQRPVVYRPKPSWGGARPIAGTALSAPSADLGRLLESAHCVVTHHSNVAVDGLVAGVPCFVREGVARALSGPWLDVEHPRCPGDSERAQWLSDLAYTQWRVEEIARGRAWAHLADEGLV